MDDEPDHEPKTVPGEKIRARGRGAERNGLETSLLQLEAGLERLRPAGDPEAVERTVPVRHREASEDSTIAARRAAPCSRLLRAEMTRAIFDMPTMLPSAPRIGESYQRLRVRLGFRPWQSASGVAIVPDSMFSQDVASVRQNGVAADSAWSMLRAAGA